jgi:Cdc6-like AAA superfamily ATPase
LDYTETFFNSGQMVIWLIFCYNYNVIEHISKSIEDTAALAAEFVKEKLSRLGEEATVVALYGDLGSGKTAFVKEVAKIIKIKEIIEIKLLSWK